jgi:Uma2 family endonuclease
LVSGERLDQAEFHRRYEVMPADLTAELIDGVVYVHGRVSADHGKASAAMIFWLGLYASDTPGTHGLARATCILGPRSELQPDASLLIRPECGGQTGDEQGCVRGAPELVAEVARASRYVDLGPKPADYERAGVQEYLVRAFDPDEILWFWRVQGAFTPFTPDPDGLYRSVTFPGLWLDPEALLAGDTRRLRQVVDQGVATPEHAAFVARLAGNRAAAP